MSDYTLNLWKGKQKMTKNEIMSSLVQEQLLIGEKIIELQNAKTLLGQAEISVDDEHWDVAVHEIKKANKNIDIDVDSFDQGLKSYIDGIEQLKTDAEEKKRSRQ